MAPPPPQMLLILVNRENLWHVETEELLGKVCVSVLCTVSLGCEGSQSYAVPAH